MVVMMGPAPRERTVAASSASEPQLGGRMAWAGNEQGG